MAEVKPQKVTINTGTIVGSTYAQLANVTVTDIDMTLEFAFVHPRDKAIGQVVARVTVPKQVGKELAKIILTTVQMHEKRKGGKKDD